ncbi:MAG: glycosyltransferase [Ectothiorhodospiraceae bacterium]|nr:glycosyltransferase [Ectothiorhodospiraceae bacterium]
MKVLYLLFDYPQLTETYIETEIRALSDRHRIEIVALRKPNVAYASDWPLRYCDDVERIVEYARDGDFDLIHTHWAFMAEVVAEVSRRTGLPWTLRGHAFDMLWSGDLRTRLTSYIRTGSRVRHVLDAVLASAATGPAHLRRAAPLINDDACLGVLALPFGRHWLERAGVDPRKIHDCRPVMDYAMFHDRGDNGEAVMNVGACIPKKNMEDFLQLARMAPGPDYHLYAVGYQRDALAARNARLGQPVSMMPPVPHRAMPAEYKKHRWLVYTSSPCIGTVGWPVAVAEAQAAGVGVCLANIRPDLADYLGGAGILFDSVAEVVDVVRGPVPDEMRERGFEQAAKSDIQRHRTVLENLWNAA